MILHLPMEPLGEGWGIGRRGPSRQSKTSDQIEVDVRAALMASVPHVTGVNNDMGPKATVDANELSRTCCEPWSRTWTLFPRQPHQCRRRRPARRPAAWDALLGKRSFHRSRPDPQRVKERILLTSGSPSEGGYAMAIGHVRPETYQGLIASLPELDQEGVRLAYLWEILERVTPDVPQLLDAVDTGNDDTPHSRETQGDVRGIAETGGSAGPDAAKLASPGAGVDPAIDDVPDPYDVTY